jgi:predicted phosphodiesterase
MEFTVWFDDGFVAYLNGQEIARSNVPAGPLQCDDPATSHEASTGPMTFTVDPGLLTQGDNVFAVEVHNSSLTSSDLSMRPTLVAWDVPPPDADITRGPFLQQVDRTSVLVVWETDQAVQSTVIYGDTSTMDRTIEDTDPKMRHVLLLPDLDPASEHFYQVQSARVPSLMGRFMTEMNRADPFRVAVYGDTRSNHNDHRAVMSQLEMEGAHIALHSGDLVGDGDIPSQYDTYFDIEAGLLLNVPQSPTLGNHERSGALYLDLFELPPNSPSPERYYWVHYSTVFYVALDMYGSAYDSGSQQFNWLETTLSDASQNSDVRHILVLLHHGPYDSGSHGSNMTVRNDLVPLFEQYGVDMVFSGHDHVYERGTVNDVKYVVTGGGGAPLYAIAGDWWTVPK